MQRILIVDDSPVVRYSLRRFIETNTVGLVCGEAEDGHAAIERVVQLSPDIVILDFHMPVMNGLDAARQITLVAPNTAMLMFTLHVSEQLVEAAKAAGVREVISKCTVATDELLASLRAIAAGS